MRSVQILSLLVLVLAVSQGRAQSEIPKGYSKGNVVLSDGSTVAGYIKEKIRSNASLTILGDDNNKKNYDGSDLLAAEIGSDKFICIKGDFFKILADGELKFLQKSSDASSKPIYNGSQAVFANGTPGSPNDYFIYTTTGKQLKLVNRKTVSAIVAETFTGCDEAISKAKSADNDIKMLSEAVAVYNSCGKKSIATGQNR